MHWNVAPDAFPGSVMFVHVMDRWLNDCIIQNFNSLLSLSVCATLNNWERTWVIANNPRCASLKAALDPQLFKTSNKVSQTASTYIPDDNDDNDDVLLFKILLFLLPELYTTKKSHM